MPTIQNVADEINAKLDQITTNTGNTVARLDQVVQNTGNAVTRLDTLNANLQAGVSHLANGLFAILEQQKLTNTTLQHHSEQNAAIICLLQNTNDLLCGITRKFTTQLDLSQRLVRSVGRLEGIAERTESAAAGDFDRWQEARREIEKCCPQPEPRPEECPEPCRVPEPSRYDPQGQDWRPGQGRIG